MSKRAVAIFGLLAGGGALAWILRQYEGGPLYAPIDLDYSGGRPAVKSGDPLTWSTPASSSTSGLSSSYYRRMSLAEAPNQDPYVKNPYSSASGLYQFTKGTWTALGGDWGSDPSKAFGGLRPSIDEQRRMAEKLTAGNVSILARAGQAVNDMSAYAVHIFGPKAVDILAAPPSTPLADLVGRSTVAKNPALGQTVASFMEYLRRKVG